MATRLVIRNQLGWLMTRNVDGLPYSEYQSENPITLDLTGIHNADAPGCLVVEIQRKCEMGEWHPIGHGSLPLYQPDLDETLDA